MLGGCDWNLWTNVWGCMIGYRRANVPNQLQPNPLLFSTKTTNSAQFSGATCMDLARDVGDKATMSSGPQAEDGTQAANRTSIKCWWMEFPKKHFHCFKHFIFFTQNLGEMIQFDEHIFQMGWFNHQLDYRLGNWRQLMTPGHFLCTTVTFHPLISPAICPGSGWHWGGGWEPYETLRIETWEWYFFMWHCSRTKLVCWAVADGQSSKKNLGFDGFRRKLRHRYVSIKTTSFLFIMFILLLLKDNEGALPSPFFLAAIWITSESVVYRPHTCDMFCFTNPTGFIPNWHCQSSRIAFIWRFDANLHQKGVANGFLAFSFIFS